MKEEAPPSHHPPLRWETRTGVYAPPQFSAERQPWHLLHQGLWAVPYPQTHLPLLENVPVAPYPQTHLPPQRAYPLQLQQCFLHLLQQRLHQSSVLKPLYVDHAVKQW
jgi:hypothetical protein